MEELKNPKTVKEVFKDYNSNSFELSGAKVIGVNLYKKKSLLEVNIQSNKLIGILDILEFEKYMEKRFFLKDAKLKIKYELENEENISEKIEKEWTSIIQYLSYKHPIAKAFLKNSTIIIENNKINVTLILSGKEFLEGNKFNEIFAETLENIYGKKYAIEYKEELSGNNEYKQKQEKLEQDEIINLTKDNKEVSSEAKQPKPVKQNYSNKQYQNNKTPAKEAPNMPPPPPLPPEEENGETPLIYGRNLNLKDQISKIQDISVDSGNVVIEGKILQVELDAKDDDINLGIKVRELKTGKQLIIFSVYDGTNTIDCKIFATAERADGIKKRLKNCAKIRIAGTAQFDPYAKQLGVLVNTAIEMPEEKKNARTDNAPVKRVELHMHTQMSTMDGITPTKNLLKRAMKWGMKSIAITDHGSVQAFPDAHKMLGVNNPDMKVLYGMEAYLVPDKVPCVSNSKGQSLDTTYCVLDLETTGFSFRTEKITEIGIMKVKNGEVIDEFECFVNPEKPIPQRVVEVTHITDDMVKDAETIDKVLPKVLKFVGDSVIVAHNADFDVGFLKYNAKQLGLSLENTYLDTLRLAKELFPDYKKYKLGVIAENLGIEVLVAHRALDDVDTTVKVFKVMIEKLKAKGAETLDDIENVFGNTVNYKKLKSFHAIILAKDYVGLKNLYKLVSISHLDYFYKKPLVLKSIYQKYSEGLILGSACEAGELYQAIEMGKDDEEIEAIARDYDYLEIQPTGNNMFLVRNGVVPNVEALQDINRKIVELGEKLDKLVVATCDVHFMDPEDEIYRRILEAGQGYADCDLQAPLYLRTTEEMLEEFSYLGEEKAYEVVVTNTNKIADMCEQISPISPEKCPPYINDCEKTIKEIAYNKAHELYGNPLPQIVEERLDKELNSIIKNGFSVMYIIAQKLVWKSNEDGYIVGSRGSVGSSFVANMTGITEVNSLPPHYRCPNCKYSDFTDYGFKNGFDLPDKDCPKCGTKMVKDVKNNKMIGEWGYAMNGKHFFMFCPHEDCNFTNRLPIQVIDEELYENPPTLLFGTVDKFAMMPWDARIGAFFACNSKNRSPELIIQDELHLISGALGTMVGLYETAVDGLASMKGVKPKIIASTATIRRAKEQCSVLYNRDVVQFPAPGLDAEDSFFAREDIIDYEADKYGRKYVGIMPSGRTKAMTEIRSIAALLQKIFTMNIPDEVKDKLWTLTVYFNSLKDLGKTSTLVDDDIKDFIIRIANRMFTGRRLVVNADELTSRVSTTELNETLDKLERIEYSKDNIDNKEYASNVLLATNMISVGIDVARLNVMLMVGQPKLTSEYIQASSRVGRSYPGVVFVQYDATKSRDRSHYERFKSYHDSFYRFVEPTGATPFSSPARERALHAVFTAIIRQQTSLLEDNSASSFDKKIYDTELQRVCEYIINRVNEINDRSNNGVCNDITDIQEELENFIDFWQKSVDISKKDGEKQLCFGKRYMTIAPQEKSEAKRS